MNVRPTQMLRATQVTIRRVMNQWWRITEGEWVAVMCRSIESSPNRMMKKSASVKTYLFIWFVWLNKTNQMNQNNQIKQNKPEQPNEPDGPDEPTGLFQGFGATDNIHEFFGDDGLPGLIKVGRQLFDQLTRVARGAVHGRHAGTLLGGRRFQQHSVRLDV